MNAKTKAFLSGVTVAVVTFVILELLTSLAGTVTIIIAIGVGICLAAFMIARSRGEGVEEVVQEIIEEVIRPDPEAFSKLSENKLMSSFEELTFTCGEDQELRKAMDDLVSVLMRVAPRADLESPDSEATFDLKQFATVNVPQFVSEYISLSDDDKTAQRYGMIGRLNGIREAALSAEEALDKGLMGEFSVTSAFTDVKLNSSVL